MVDDVGTPLEMFNRVDLCEAMDGFDEFLTISQEKLGGSWDNVQVFLYPAMINLDELGDRPDPSEIMVRIHVVLWASAMKTLVGAHEIGLYDVPMTDIVRIGPAIDKVLQEHGLDHPEVLPAQPYTTCEGCGAPMFMTPEQDWMHPDDGDIDDGNAPVSVQPFSHPPTSYLH